MQDRMKFREALQEVELLAQQNGNRITKEEVETCLKAFSLTEEQTALVYGYLEAQRISVEGYEASGEQALPEAHGAESNAQPMSGEEQREAEVLEDRENLLTEEDKIFLEEYQIAAGSAKEPARILEQYVRRELDREAVVRGYMGVCAEAALAFIGRGIPLADLVQEGNVGLLMALDTLELREDTISEDEYIRGGIRGAMESLLEEEAVLKESDDRILEKINYIAEAIRNLSEELERKVSLEELSAYLEMPEEEVAEILKLTGEEIETKEPEAKEKDAVGYAGIDDFKIF